MMIMVDGDCDVVDDDDDDGDDDGGASASPRPHRW